MLDAVAHHYLAPKHGTVIYNGRFPELFDPDRGKGDYVLSVGRIWDEGKHVSLLLEAQNRSKRTVGMDPVDDAKHTETAYRSTVLNADSSPEGAAQLSPEPALSEVEGTELLGRGC